MDYSKFSNKALLIIILRYGARTCGYMYALRDARRHNHDEETQCLIYRLESKIDLMKYLLQEAFYHTDLAFCN